jgi:hypothetical protein
MAPLWKFVVKERNSWIVQRKGEEQIQQQNDTEGEDPQRTVRPEEKNLPESKSTDSSAAMLVEADIQNPKCSNKARAAQWWHRLFFSPDSKSVSY